VSYTPDVDPADLPLEDWIARTRSKLDAVDAEYDAIRRQERPPQSPDVTEVRSPLGYLSVRMRGGGPISLHGNPQALDSPSDTVLRASSRTAVRELAKKFFAAVQP
jgi:hypothetical protein